MACGLRMGTDSMSLVVKREGQRASKMLAKTVTGFHHESIAEESYNFAEKPGMATQ
jgi:hypothetical protein